MPHFRIAKLEDLDRISRLVNSAYRGETSKKGWTTEAHLLDGQRTDVEKLQEMIQDENSYLLLAFSDDPETRLLASVFLKKESSDTLYLGMLSVDPNSQASGIGKLLLLESEKMAKRLGCTEIRMTVIHLRTELLEFYERRGFVKTGNSEDFPSQDPRFGIPKVLDLRLLELVKKI